MPPLRRSARHNQRPVNAAAASTPVGKALSPASLALDTGHLNESTTHLNESTTQSSLPQSLDPQPTAPLSDPSKHVVATTQSSSLTNPQRAAELNDLFMLVEQAGERKRDTSFWQAIADGLVEREWRRRTPMSVQSLYYVEKRKDRTRKNLDPEFKPWSPEEIDKLFEQLARHASRNDRWDLVAAELVSANFPRRTPQALQSMFFLEKRLRPAISLPRGPPRKFSQTGALLETTNIVGGTGTSPPPPLGFTNDSIGAPPRPRTGRRPSLLVGQQAELSEDSAATRSSRPVYKNDEELIGPPPPSRPRHRPLLPDRDVVSQRGPTPSRIPLHFVLPTVPGDAALAVTAGHDGNKWSPAEDAKILALLGPLKGNIDAVAKDAIAKELPGRTVKAIMRRWFRLKNNALDRQEEYEWARQQRLAQKRLSQLACARAVALQ